jgi:hypothetical protein
MFAALDVSQNIEPTGQGFFPVDWLCREHRMMFPMYLHHTHQARKISCPSLSHPQLLPAG